MATPMVTSRTATKQSRTLPLTRLRTLLLRELDNQATQASESRATVSILRGQSDVDSVLAREIAEASASQAEDTIAEVDRALDRLDNGTYGTCEQCGVAIPIERLEALPHTRRCVNCTGMRSGLVV